VTNTSVPQPESVPQPDKEPYHPPTRQDYEDLIEHHYLIRAFTFFPLIFFAFAMYIDADYGPLHFLTGVAMNVGVLATCLTIPLAIPVMIRDAREALWSHPDMVPSETELATPDTFLTLRQAAAEEDADIDAALNSLLDGTLGWADGLEPGDEASAGSGDEPEDPEASNPKGETD